MARQILPIVGAAVGFVVTGGNPMGAQAGFAIGSIVGNAIDPIEMQGRKLGDAPTQVAAEGGARAIVFGKGCIRATCVIERGGRRVIKERQSQGKGSGPTTVNERALWTFAIGLGEAIPDGSILRIWEAEKLVYDVTPDSAIPGESAKFAAKFRFYDGSDDQLPDPALEALHGTGNAPYYRGTAYLVFPQYDLTDFGETVPPYRVEVATNVQATPGSEWFEAVPYEGDGIGLATIDTLNLSQGGMVIVARVDAPERPTIFFKQSGGSVRQMYNYTVLAGAPDNPASTTATFSSNGKIGLPMNTAGGSYMAYVFKNKAGAFNIASYTGNGVAGHTVPHGLGATPKFHFVRQDPDPNYTFGWTHITPFNGSAFVRITDNDDQEPSTQQWNGVPPGLVNVTLGFHGQVNGNGRNYLLFSAGGDDVYSGTFTTGSDVSIGFDPDFILMKRRGTAEYNWGALTSDTLWSGDELTTLIHGTTGAAGFMINRITRVSPGVYRVNTSPDPAGWSGRTMDFIAIRGGAWVPGSPITLGQIVYALHLRCGHSSGDVDVSELTEIVSGVVIEQTVTASEAIISILGAHFADPSDYDGKIHYIKRGKPAVRAIGEDDLVDEPEEAKRNNAIEYPRKVHLLGQRADLAYSAAKSTSARYSKDARVVGEASVASPETFDEGETPLKAAIKLHKVLWTKAEGELTIHVTDEHLDLVPTDCVDFSYSGRTFRYMIDQISDDPGVRKLKMTRDRQSAYVANPIDIPTPPPPTPPQPSTPTDTILAIIDGPALLDNADTLHYLAAATGDGDPWVGFTLQQSLDGGATFVSIDTGSLNAIMGELQAVVPAASPYYTDTTNRVIVRLYTDDELESRTQQAFLSNGGAFFLSWQDSGDTFWELMQFRDAAQVGDTWELSRLLRGRKNTEAAEHPAGATFVYLDTAVLREAAQSAWIGTELTHRAVSNGLSPEAAEVQQNLFVGNSQREWPVAELMLERAGDDITATVVPRHRFGTSMNPIRSINWTGYRWTATDGANTITRDGTSAFETFDATGWASPVSVTVSQLNRITGPGDAVTENIT